MDVLDYWNPPIDWSRFQQGGLSDAMWRHFRELVRFCNAHRHWEEAARQARSTRGREQKNAIDECKGRMYRAAFRVQEEMSTMATLISDEDVEKPDGVLYFALRRAIAPFPNHEKARCGAAAVDSFDANQELKGEPPEIAKRWLDRAGIKESR
jgi:hypothetical protein